MISKQVVLKQFLSKNNLLARAVKHFGGDVVHCIVAEKLV